MTDSLPGPWWRDSRLIIRLALLALAVTVPACCAIGICVNDQRWITAAAAAGGGLVASLILAWLLESGTT